MQQVISITGLSKSFGSKDVLKDINLTVNKGEIIGYIGANGAGKSTTVKIILGLIEDYGGKVEIFGKDIRENPVDYKKRIGYVPETADIYENLTAREYLTFIGNLYGMSYDESNSKASKLMDLFGIRSVYDGRINSFSKGMKQKVLIIASLINDPDILFLDEPLSGIDANSVLVFKEVIQGLSEQGKTIFYSSHIMEVVEKMSDRIILLNDGLVVADGNMESLDRELEKGTLEQIFNKLTGFEDHEKIAKEIISTIRRGEKIEGL